MWRSLTTPGGVGDPRPERNDEAAEDVSVFGGGRSGRDCVVNAGDLPGKVTEPDLLGRGDPCPAEVRAAIVATKPGNSGGAKGGRKANRLADSGSEVSSPSIRQRVDWEKRTCGNATRPNAESRS
jgi:hypothetical protein